MRQALFLPAFDGLAEPDRVVRLAQLAESVGWDGFFLWDHLSYSAPVRDILDPYICLAAVAQATESILLGPLVTPLVRRRPQVVARQVMTLERLAPGRVVLGLGIGDDGGDGELSSFGEVVDARARGRALDEGLTVLDALWSGARVHHVGEFYRADGVQFLPTPTQPLPLWLAARWPNRAPLRRSARYQGVVSIQMTEPANAVTLRADLVAFGADLSNFDVVVLADDTYPAQEWADAGVTWLLTQLGPYNLDYDEARERVARGPRPVKNEPKGAT